MTARLRRGLVLQVREDSCDVMVEGQRQSLRYARQFPSPRTERVSPGNLVAFANAGDGAAVIVWRWYDAVVIGEADGSIRLWEPTHGEVSAQPRPAFVPRPLGARAYLSAGLPGADWWVAGPATASAADADVELDEVLCLYIEYGLWDDLI